MKKRETIAAALIVFALSLGSVLATGNLCEDCDEHSTCCGNYSNAGMTIIQGKVYEGELSNGIKGANVSITCYHEGNESTKNSVSWHNGKYLVFFQQSKCDYGDSLTVIAEKNELTGTNYGNVNLTSGTQCFELDVGVVNVPLIPEFGAVIGALTVLLAIGIFFFVRKN